MKPQQRRSARIAAGIDYPLAGVKSTRHTYRGAAGAWRPGAVQEAPSETRGNLCERSADRAWTARAGLVSDPMRRRPALNFFESARVPGQRRDPRTRLQRQSGAGRHAARRHAAGACRSDCLMRQGHWEVGRSSTIS
eukprot:361100-Chlamydomonas_euryale.AAC.22